MKRLVSLLVLGSALSAPIAADDSPLGLAEVETAMREATSFYRTRLGVAGGYASSWPSDLGEGSTEHRDSPTVISIQPHGTTTVGLALIDAYRATGDAVHLQGAREAASALMWCQLASGGWASAFDFAPAVASRYHYRRDLLAGDVESGKRRNRSTLDDHKTQSALHFLLELAHLPESEDDTELHAAVQFGFDGLLAAQFPNGAWPQQFTGPAPSDLPADEPASFPEKWPRKHPDEPYHHHYTLNDHNLLRVMKLLLRASELTGEPRYLTSARRLGDFLLLAQLPEPQRGWAQQYDRDMHPAWARKFEPPAVSSVESVGAIEALVELWIATGEGEYVENVPAALDWLEASRLDDGRWARFYELETNRPLYCEADTYHLTHDDADLPTHYAFQIDASLGRKLERLREALEREPAAIRRSRADPDDADGWERRARHLRGRVEEALRERDDRGVWVRDDRIEARSFVEHVRTMAAWVEARKQAEP